MFSGISIFLIGSMLVCTAVLAHAVYMSVRSFKRSNDLFDSDASLTELLESSKRLEQVNLRMKEILDKGGK